MSQQSDDGGKTFVPNVNLSEGGKAFAGFLHAVFTLLAGAHSPAETSRSADGPDDSAHRPAIRTSWQKNGHPARHMAGNHEPLDVLPPDEVFRLDGIPELHDPADSGDALGLAGLSADELNWLSGVPSLDEIAATEMTEQEDEPEPQPTAPPAIVRPPESTAAPPPRPAPVTPPKPVAKVAAKAAASPVTSPQRTMLPRTQLNGRIRHLFVSIGFLHGADRAKLLSLLDEVRKERDGFLGTWVIRNRNRAVPMASDAQATASEVSREPAQLRQAIETEILARLSALGKTSAGEAARPSDPASNRAQWERQMHGFGLDERPPASSQRTPAQRPVREVSTDEDPPNYVLLRVGVAYDTIAGLREAMRVLGTVSDGNLLGYLERGLANRYVPQELRPILEANSHSTDALRSAVVGYFAKAMTELRKKLRRK